MSYDIYGNCLRPGHCEVHPHVHEDYPCSVCHAETLLHNRQQQLKYERDMQRQYEMECEDQYNRELAERRLTEAIQDIS